MFTSFQNDYIDKHAILKTTKIGLWTLLLLAVTGGTAAGLFAISFGEGISEQIVNATSFGVWFCVILNVVAVFALLAGSMAIGASGAVMGGLRKAANAKAESASEAANVQLDLDASVMMAQRGAALAVLRPRLSARLLLAVSRLATGSLLVALVISGYNFGALIVFSSMVLGYLVTKQIRNKSIRHVLTLTPESVSLMERLLDEQEHDKIITIESNVVEPNES